MAVVQPLGLLDMLSFPPSPTDRQRVGGGLIYFPVVPAIRTKLSAPQDTYMSASESFCYDAGPFVPHRHRSRMCRQDKVTPARSTVPATVRAYMMDDDPSRPASDVR